MGPALIQCELVPGRSGMLHREIAITLRASMEHPYYLTVRRERFSGREDEESGVFELSVRRNIRSSDPARTPYLLQNPRLRELLRAEPGAWLQISPLQTGAQEHLVSVRKDAEHLEESVDSRGRAAGRDVPNQRKLYAEPAQAVRRERLPGADGRPGGDGPDRTGLGQPVAQGTQRRRWTRRPGKRNIKTAASPGSRTPWRSWPGPPGTR